MIELRATQEGRRWRARASEYMEFANEQILKDFIRAAGLKVDYDSAEEVNHQRIIIARKFNNNKRK